MKSNEFKIMIPMHTLLKPKATDKFKLFHNIATVDDVKMMKFRDSINENNEFEGFIPGTYVTLTDKTKGEIVMSDTWMEWKTNLDVLNQAKGDVLIAGLGIGMILMSLQNKENITSITVIEKEKDIIEMVASQLKLNNKVKVIHSDIFNYETNQTFDTIYFDIWNTIGTINFPSMIKLHDTWKDKLNTDGWINSWRYEDCVDFDYDKNERKAF